MVLEGYYNYSDIDIIAFGKKKERRVLLMVLERY